MLVGIVIAVVIVLAIAFGAWRMHRRPAGVTGGLGFDVGLQASSDPVPEGDDVWATIHSPLAAEDLDITLNARPVERTQEMLQRETTYFEDDLTDPRNPRHAQWEARHEAAIKEGELERGGNAGAAPPSDPPDDAAHANPAS